MIETTNAVHEVQGDTRDDLVALLNEDLAGEYQAINSYVVYRYRQRVRQCEALGEYAVAEQIRDILVQEQDHQIALATALGMEVPNVANRE